MYNADDLEYGMRFRLSLRSQRSSSTTNDFGFAPHRQDMAPRPDLRPGCFNSLPERHNEEGNPFGDSHV